MYVRVSVYFMYYFAVVGGPILDRSRLKFDLEL